ncbi:MAG: thioredoxin family protein [Candidatus Eisenbacteria bacterium]|nr:thioredoxin family protein [Candidatus Eisenbacteria bacterium]MCC7142144.1 thioredoxin family protein [Candidatus Eisenbacteria bacterium]
MFRSFRALLPMVAVAVLSLAASGLATAKEAEVGKKAPEFSLKDTDGKAHKLSDWSGKVVVLEWFNPDCPFVKAKHATTKQMAELYGKYKDQLVWVAINSSADGKQGFGLERNQTARKEYAISYPILLDPEGTVGKLYGAKTTPHMMVIGTDGNLLYKGAYDDAGTPGSTPQVNYVDQALRELLGGKKVTVAETKPYGCSVKYAG